MPTVAEQLKLAREAQGLKVHQVADMTKIRGDHLRALETGNYDVFSAPIYIRGFVRTYATLLKLDVQGLLDQLNRELTQANAAEPALSQPPAGGAIDSAMFHLAKFSRRMALPVVVAVVVIASIVTAYVVWSHNQNKDPLEGLSAGVYSTGTSSGETLPLPH